MEKARLKQLLDCEERLQLLENAGVDNWEGYDIAMEAYEEQKEILCKIDDLVQLITEQLSSNIETNMAGPGTGHGFFQEGLDEVEKTITEWLKENTTLFEIR